MQRLPMAALISLLIWTSPAIAAKSIEIDLPKTTDATFAQDVLNSPEPVFLDFYATWCVPCKEMEPVVRKLSEDYKGKIKVFAIDGEKNPNAAERYGIAIFPSYCLFVKGKVAAKQYGLKKPEELKQMLTQAHVI